MQFCVFVLSNNSLELLEKTYICAVLTGKFL